MPEVSFYVLPSKSEAERYLFICKLVEKAYREQHCVYILTASEEQTRHLDDLLWTFRPGSFIPHQVYSGTQPTQENPVLIGALKAPAGRKPTVINLAQNVLETPDDYERIIEVLDNSETSKQAGRKRYRQYQQLGLTPKTHAI